MPCHRRALVAAGQAGAGHRRACILHRDRYGHRPVLDAGRGLQAGRGLYLQENSANRRGAAGLRTEPERGAGNR